MGTALPFHSTTSVFSFLLPANEECCSPKLCIIPTILTPSSPLPELIRNFEEEFVCLYQA